MKDVTVMRVGGATYTLASVHKTKKAAEQHATKLEQIDNIITHVTELVLGIVRLWGVFKRAD